MDEAGELHLAVCRRFGEAVAAANGLPDDPHALAATGMFSAPVATGDETDTQAKLLARLGRNPRWRPASL